MLYKSIVILGVSCIFCRFCSISEGNVVDVDPDQMLHYVASDLLWVSR